MVSENEQGPDYQVKQYQDKKRELNIVQEEVMDQIGKTVKWPSAIKRWKYLLRGAIATADKEKIVPGKPGRLVTEFLDGWLDILRQYGKETLKPKKIVPDDLFEELAYYLDDWQSSLGMGFSRRKKNMDLSDPIRWTKLIDKDVDALIHYYQRTAACYHQYDIERLTKEVISSKSDLSKAERVLEACKSSFDTDEIEEILFLIDVAGDTLELEEVDEDED